MVANTTIRRLVPPVSEGTPQPVRRTGAPTTDLEEEIAAETVVVERYRILGTVGRGGMGIVYLAEHLTVGRKVAIKVLARHWSSNTSVVARFRAEAKAAVAAGHPNIIEVFDAGELPDGRLFLVMEFLAGRNLYEELHERGSFPIERACKIVREVAKAIRAAHGVGIIHRDLKAENVMIVARAEGESVKVLDFGISAGVADPDGARATLPGLALGTPESMSPEQARGGPASELFDVYALGVMLFELLTGQPPHHCDSPLETVARKLTEPAPSLATQRSDAPVALVELARGCLEMDPSERIRSAGDIIIALDAIIGTFEVPRPTPVLDVSRWAQTQPESVPMVDRPTRLERPPTREWRALLPSYGVGALVLGILAWVAWPSARAPEDLPDPPMTWPEPERQPVRSPDVVLPEVVQLPVPSASPVPTLVTNTVATEPTQRVPAPEIRTTGTKTAPAGARAGKADPSSPACRRTRGAAEDARAAHDWSGLLRHAEAVSCWSPSERRKLKTQALMELKHFPECVKQGTGLSDPEVQRWVRLCTKRAAQP